MSDMVTVADQREKTPFMFGSTRVCPTPSPLTGKDTQRLRARVLTVDDCEDTAVLLRTYLADPGIIVKCAKSGRQGLDMFQNDSFDLVLLDIGMPGMDGYQTNAAMREYERKQCRARTPIVALTAAADFASSYAILSLGFDLHLVKPISRITLLQNVRQFGRLAA